MNIFEIKEEHKSAIVGFNGSGLPLGKRTDLDVLAEMAHRNKNLAKYFVELPSMEAIKAYRTGEIVKEIEGAATAGTDDSEPETAIEAVAEVSSQEQEAGVELNEVEETPTESKRGKKGNNRA